MFQFAIAALTLYHPPASVVLRENDQGQVIDRTITSDIDSTVIITLVGAAMGCILYAVNGLRLARFSVGSFAAESAAVTKAVEGMKTTEEIKGASDEDMRSITNDDVISALKRVPDFAGYDLASKAPLYRRSLVFNGIATTQQLDELVSSPAILNTLRALYIRILGRKEEMPLDPDGLVAWGPALYRLGNNSEVIREVETRLRESTEFYHKHYIAGGTGLS